MIRVRPKKENVGCSQSHSARRAANGDDEEEERGREDMNDIPRRHIWFLRWRGDQSGVFRKVSMTLLTFRDCTWRGMKGRVTNLKANKGSDDASTDRRQCKSEVAYGMVARGVIVVYGRRGDVGDERTEVIEGDVDRSGEWVGLGGVNGGSRKGPL